MPHRPRRRARRWLLLPGAVALVLTTSLVWQSSYAGFGDSAAPFAASVRTGTLKLSNSISMIGTSVSFDEVYPGESDSNCITVTSTGSLPADVRLYGTGKSVTKSLDKYIGLSWVTGTGGGVGGECDGFVASGTPVNSTLSSFPTAWATGVLPWTTTGTTTESRTYRLTTTVDSNAPATTKGGTVVVTFVWEAQTR